jgi:hypothetical protein
MSLFFSRLFTSTVLVATSPIWLLATLVFAIVFVWSSGEIIADE